MNNDELLAMYLDGTLSEGQRTDFDRLLQTSPTFAQEVREILTIQGMLFEPALDDARTSAFLRTVENNLATAVIAAGAAATAGTIAAAVGKSAFAATTTAVGSTTAASTATTASAASVGAGTISWASSLLSTIFASTTSMVVSAGIGAATIASGAAVVNYVVKKNAAEKQIAERQATEPAGERQTATAQETVAQNPETQVKSPQASTADHTTPDITAQRQADAQNGASAPAAVIKEDNAQSDAQANAKPREYTARISGGSMQGRYADAIADYGKQLQAKEASHDRTAAAFIEKSLGALLRQAGNASESRVHLNNAVKAAHELGLQELEGEARAELALVDAAEGKKARAVQGLQEALGILNTTKSTTVARWQKELDKLTGK